MKSTWTWNKDASLLLKQFLSTPAGGQFLEALRAARPAWPQITSTDDFALRAALIAGFEAALDTILWLADEQSFENSVKTDDGELL